MPWTNPASHVYASSEFLTASTLNTYVQQNLAFLGGPYYCRAYANTSMSIATNVATLLNLNATDFDPNSNFNTGTNLYVAPVAGRYTCTGSVKMNTMSGYIQLRILVNGTLKAVSGDYAGSSQNMGCQISTILSLNASDQVFLNVWQSSSTTVNTYIADGTGVNNYMAIACIGPP